jgi:SAM-dependent methyltransferase
MNIEKLKALYGDYLDLHRRRFDDTLALLSRHDGAADGKHRKLLDVGIFPGFMAAMAQERGYDIWGIANEEMTPEFRDFAATRDFKLAELDVETDPFPFGDEFFDTVLCTEIIEHMHRNPFALIEKCFRALKPGGCFLLSTPNLARLPVISGLISEQSYMSPLEGPIDESFPVNKCYTHCREYTMPELHYMACAQDKYLYRFLQREKIYSRCWDAGLRCRIQGIRNPATLISETLKWAAVRHRPHLRSCLMYLAVKPEVCHRIDTGDFSDVKGLHETEEDTDTSSSNRRPLPTPFRWTSGNATLLIPNACPGLKEPARLLMLCAYVVPGDAHDLQVFFKVNGRDVKAQTFSPGKAYRLVELPLSKSDMGRDRIEVSISSGTWNPSDYGLPDKRALGIMISWGEVLLIADRL